MNSMDLEMSKIMRESNLIDISKNIISDEIDYNLVDYQDALKKLGYRVIYSNKGKFETITIYDEILDVVVETRKYRSLI